MGVSERVRLPLYSEWVLGIQLHLLSDEIRGRARNDWRAIFRIGRGGLVGGRIRKSFNTRLGEASRMGVDREEMVNRDAKFRIGAIVRHRFYPFRGVIYDVDPTFSNTEEWWQSIPEDVRPAKNQPYYHLLAENDEGTYAAYVSEQNLVPDESGEPCLHPLVEQIFDGPSEGHYDLKVRTDN